MNKFDLHITGLRRAAMSASTDESENAILTAAAFLEQVEATLKIESIGNTKSQFNRGRIWLANRLLGVTKE